MDGDFDARRHTESADRLVAGIAHRQFGVFSREQLTQIGVSRDVLRRRKGAVRWVPVAPGVFVFPAAPRSWEQSLMISLLAWGRDAAVSHRAAASLWALAGFSRHPAELTLPAVRRRRALRPGLVHQGVLPPVDVTLHGPFRVTTVARTLVDLAAVAPISAVEAALDDARRRRLVSLTRLRWRLSELARSGRPGIALMRALLDERDPSAVSESVFEARFLRAMLDYGLPRPVLQLDVRVRGRRTVRVDFAYPDVRLAIETVGYRWHSSRERWEQDQARLNELTLLGWRVIHVTWREFERRPRRILASIEAALMRPAAREENERKSR